MALFKGGIFPRLVALFPLFFPLYLVRGEAFGIPVTLPEVLLFFMLLYFVIREEIWKDSWLHIHKKQFLLWPVLVFLLAAVISIFVAPEISYFADGSVFEAKRRALGDFKGFILAPVLYFFMARFYFKEKPSLIPLALRALLLGGAVLSVHALYQEITGDFITMDSRASGPFVSANYLALYLGPLTVYGILALLKSKDLNERIFLGTMTLLVALALYFTASFAAWFSVFASVLVFMLQHLRRLSRKTQLLFFMGFVLVGAALLASQIGTEKFTQFLEFSQRSSSSVRLQIYEISLALVKENPLLGIGLGQYEQAYSANALPVLGHEPFELVMIHPHNIFLAFWLNTGLLGLLAFLFILKEAFAWLREKDKHERRITAFMLLTIILHGLFDTPAFKNDLAFEFWLLLAMLI